MVNENQIFDVVTRYLAGNLVLEDLEDWSAEASIDNYNNPDKKAQALVYSMRGLLAEHENDESEESVKTAILELVWSQ